MASEEQIRRDNAKLREISEKEEKEVAADAVPACAACRGAHKKHTCGKAQPQDADGNYPCAQCGRVFDHAPAAVAHSKACECRPGPRR